MRAWLGVWALVAAAAWPALGQETKIRALARIVVPAAPDNAERDTAALLAKELGEVYGAKLAADAGGKAEGPCIVLGRGAALAAGLVTSADLEPVMRDGYLIRSRGGQVAIAGYAPQGTIYGAHEFLRRVGIRRYPWHLGGQLRVVEAVPEGVLPALDVASKPFFEYRHMLGHHDRGPFGGTLDPYGLGGFREYQQHEYFKDKGWLGADHTAPFLVPAAVYHDKRPEYYAMLRNGKRLPKSTQNCRVALCLSNPDVHRIASKRALEWMAEQKARRFFYITDGDTSECVCPACLAMDPAPFSYTDRYLSWVNSVAGAVKIEFPDKVCLALAYGAATLPPVNVKPESNVVVMYCPWYWNSRATSAVTWANPLNIAAMKEFMAWNMRFPGQMGLYDYPGDWVGGQAGRIKFLARKGARFFHGCGGGEELYHWVNSRLLWDPFQDSEALRDEFVKAYYGRAAGPMGEYLALRERLIESRFTRSMTWLDDPAFFARTRELMEAASRLAAGAAPDVQCRVSDAVQAAMLEVLRQTSPRAAQGALRSSPEVFATDLRLYTDAARRSAAFWRERRSRHAERQTVAAFEKGLESLGLGKASKPGEAAKEEGAEVFDRAADGLAEQARALAAQAPPASAPSAVTVRFDGADEARRWILDGTEPKLLSAPEAAALERGAGLALCGVRLRAPLAKLPVIEARKQRVHAGRFYAERVFEPAVDAGAVHLLLLHLHASNDVPVALYLDRFHADFSLHAGEQIVRVDLRNLAPR